LNLEHHVRLRDRNPSPAAGHDPARDPLGLGPRVRGALLVLGACATLAGCAPDTSPLEDPGDEDPGFMLVEGSPAWSTNAVSFRDSASGLGYAMVSVAVDAPIGGSEYFIYRADFSLSCNNSDCWPLVSQIFVEPGLSIFDLTWSPRGPLIVFEGRDIIFGTRIYSLQPGSDPRAWVTGFDPTFTPDAGLVVYVENGRDAIRSFNPSSGGGFVERDGLTSVSSPAVSPDGRWLAYSAQDGSRGRRIFVHDRLNPTFFADTVSDPDQFPAGQGTVQDGTDDDYPVWSPHGTYVAFRAKVNAGTIYDAIFVTRPGGEPERIDRVGALRPGRQLMGLRWHSGGEILLAVVDGDVYAFSMPAAYRDR
jgi:hypothetical protein